MNRCLLAVFLAGTFFGQFSVNAATLIPYDNPEILEYVKSKAMVLSGRATPRGEKLPPVYLVSKADLYEIVCGDAGNNCRSLAAVFDDVEYRILILNDFSFEANFDVSFLIHETVHALQYLNDGPEIFRDCAAILETETEAYRVQDAFLKKEGEFFRAGIALRYFFCDEEQAAEDYKNSLDIWNRRKHHP